LFLPIIAYTLCSTKLETRAKLFLPGIEGVGGKREEAEWVVKEGVWAGGINDPSIVCTYE
jgi:hypothetical protein